MISPRLSPANSPEKETQTFNMNLRQNRSKSSQFKSNMNKKAPKKKKLSHFLKIKRKSGRKPEASMESLVKNENSFDDGETKGTQYLAVFFKKKKFLN